ncbi:MAG: four helix bundle protein [Synechococcales cyanobacterium RM1_1_8]|nr:four helix bundle protein [Synechococcales cyanobacterium RM1_1_8]
MSDRGAELQRPEADLAEAQEAGQPSPDQSSNVLEFPTPLSSSGAEAIQIWTEGMQLADLCYQATQMFPPQRAYGLDAQIRITASSIPATLAQGYEQAAAASYADCVERARGALLELKSQLRFSERLSLVTPLINQILLEECDLVRERLESLLVAA